MFRQLHQWHNAQVTLGRHELCVQAWQHRGRTVDVSKCSAHLPATAERRPRRMVRIRRNCAHHRSGLAVLISPILIIDDRFHDFDDLRCPEDLWVRPTHLLNHSDADENIEDPVR
jgi:hypothetical protein